jgi:hypothetical protein
MNAISPAQTTALNPIQSGQNQPQMYAYTGPAVPLDSVNPMEDNNKNSTPFSPLPLPAAEAKGAKPQRRRIGQLESMADLYRELTLLYRDAYHGRITAEMYTKCAYVLDCASRTLMLREKFDAEYRTMQKEAFKEFMREETRREALAKQQAAGV